MTAADERFLKYAHIEVYDVRDPADDGLRERMWCAEAEACRLREALKRSRRREFCWVVAFWLLAGEFVFTVIMTMRAR